MTANISGSMVYATIFCFYSGELSVYEIDQFSFSPDIHTLTIVFNLTTGDEGVHQYNFTGRVRERELLINAVILLADLNLAVWYGIALYTCMRKKIWRFKCIPPYVCLLSWHARALKRLLHVHVHAY